MKVSILGATGCVGSALVNKLMQSNEHDIIASYRSGRRMEAKAIDRNVTWRDVDLQDVASIQKFLDGADVLVYLIHSLSSPSFEKLDKILAHNVGGVARNVGIKKIVYVSGIIPKQSKLSPHLKSRMETGIALASYGIPVSEIRASILLGPDSASFRIIYFLASRLPIMITPKWLNSLCAPIALEDAVDAIEALITRTCVDHEIFEIGSDVMRYRDLLTLCGKAARGFGNMVVPVPLFAISLSSLWIELVTGVPNVVARNLAESLIDDSVYTINRFQELTGRNPVPVVQVLQECALKMKKERNAC